MRPYNTESLEEVAAVLFMIVLFTPAYAFYFPGV